MFYYYSILLILLLLVYTNTLFAINRDNQRNLFYMEDVCFNHSDLYIDVRDNSPDHEIYDLKDHTSDCVTSFRGDDQKYGKTFPFCDPGVLDVTILPIYMPFDYEKYSPEHIRLNATATFSDTTTSTIYMRYECASGVFSNDVYCKEDVKQRPPCRSLTIYNTSKIEYPVTFGYRCFVIYELSSYFFNVTIFPQMCRRSLLLTAPLVDKMFPTEEAQYNKSTPWSPMIIVDYSTLSGVWVTTVRDPDAYCESISIEIYKYDDDDNLNQYDVLEFTCEQSSTVFWEGGVAGRYVFFGWSPTDGCVFFCKNNQTCTQCPRTQLFVRFDEERTTFKWRLYNNFHTFLYELIFCVIAAFVLIMTTMLSYNAYARWRNKNKGVIQVQLEQLVETLVVYCDDGDEHMDCVRHFVKCLQMCSSVEVLFNEDDMLHKPNVRPSQWVLNNFINVKKVIFLLSPCTVLLMDDKFMEGKHLVQRRPFPDIYKPAMTMLSHECFSDEKASKKKFAFVLLPYSPPIPQVVKTLGLRVFNGLSEFAQLTAFLHDYEFKPNGRFISNLSEDLRETFIDKIRTVMEMIQDSEDYPENLFAKNEPPPKLFWDNVKPNKSDPPRFVKTNKDRRKVSEFFGILPPSETPSDEEEDDGEREEVKSYEVVLLEPDESSDND